MIKSGIESGVQPLRCVAVVGGGIVAMSAAIAFARALPRTQILLVPAPVDRAALADRFPVTFGTGPALLERIGIDPDALIAAGAVMPRLATRYLDWNHPGDAWLVGEGDLVVTGAASATYLLWLRALADKPPPLDHLSPAVVAALAGRSIVEAPTMPSPAPPPAALFANAGEAWRIDPARALPLLARIAAACNVARAPAPFAGYAQTAGGPRTLRLADGGTLAADLYIDATGPSRLLAGADRTAWIDWSDALPCDRLRIAPATRDETAIDTYRATQTGWRATWPGIRAIGYAASITREADAQRALAGPDAGAIAVAPGRVERAWNGGVLAIGDAAVQPGPLGQTGYALALEQIALALDLLPGREPEPLLIAEYNRRTARRSDRLRDFCALPYRADGRRTGPFWRTAKMRPRPPDVETMLAGFARRGQIAHSEDDSFARDAWASLLIGLGVRPAAPDPVLLSIPPVAASAMLHRIADALATAAATLPSHPDFAA